MRMLWYISGTFWAFVQKNGSAIVLLHQTKPCNDMELDTKVSSHKDIIKKNNKISEYTVDETLLKVGSEYVWLWVSCY
jgi:hypothetical protein